MATGRRLSYWNPRLLRTLFLQLQQQQEQGLFCDVTLQGDGDDLHAHSCIIAACSPYLAKLLSCSPKMSDVIVESGGPVLRNRRILNVRGIPSHTLLPLVRYMYTSELEVAPADAYDVLQTASKLRIPVLENLQLEGGRIIRPETGRKLNRGCFGSKNQTSVVNSLQHSEIGWVHDEDRKPKDDQLFFKCGVKDSHSPYMLENKSSSCSLSKTILGEQHLLEHIKEDTPHVKVTLKRLHNSSEKSPNQNHLCTLSKQNKSSQECVIDLVKIDKAEKPENHDTPQNVNLKKRKLNRVAKLDISQNTSVSISHHGKLKENMIKISKTENMGKQPCTANLTGTLMIKDGSHDHELSNVKHNISCMDEDTRLKESKSAEDLTSAPLYDEIQNENKEEDLAESLAFKEMDNKKDEGNFLGTAGPIVSCPNISSSLEDLKKTELDLTEIQKDTFFGDSDASMTCFQSITADESETLQICTNVPSVHEVEKMKLRKIKNGPSWEIVKDVYLDTVSASENPECVHDFEEFLEQILNLPSSASDVDVGGNSPVIWTGECVWPDPSSESDEEVDILS